MRMSSGWKWLSLPYVLVLSLGTTSAMALQEKTPPMAPEKGPPTTPADVHSRYEPPSGPGAGQAFLKTFEGEWTVERNFYPPSGGAPSRATGECTQKMIKEGR